jgi:hypothetical protein
MQYKFHIFLSAILLISLSACSPSRFVRPLEKGQTAISADLGGPLVKFAGTTVPIPLSSISVGHGFSSTCTGFAGLHTTAMVYKTVHLDVGFTKQLSEARGWRPGFSVSPMLNFMISTRDKAYRFFPQLDVNAFWNYGKKNHFCYVGIANFIETRGLRSYNEMQSANVIPNFHVGNTFNRTKMNYTLEAKYLAPFLSNTDKVVKYASIGEKGAIGVYFSIARKF